MPNDDTSSSSTTQETDSEAIQIGQLAHDSDSTRPFLLPLNLGVLRLPHADLYIYLLIQCC
jgi:hypothetical protein